ncbi:TetR family transcriptional regulator [Zoogloea dura]|jgi:TetR/AcrR family acrAB operon transcriptional repressor|uniref:TetR family transcriptional regulator n=1 Tax=Zoogloea dura TaxID=2728840 RepID=A0A848G9U1_9RHOO|nr:TetR family transcriptional regulator [Zoogloea dura]NML27606.1 TetR family transcriptional regulator [Zoogloea dura]
MVRKTKEEAEVTRRHIIDAARQVFRDCGVRSSTLEKVAAAAGVTRGAVYWHFRNKTELFFAMREEATLPFVDRVVFDLNAADPLAGIEVALREIFVILEDHADVREIFEILSFKCEYVDEFKPMMGCSDGQMEFLQKLTEAYRQAGELGALRPGLSASDLAHDTFLFIGGLIKHWLAASPNQRFRSDALSLIHNHIMLRRI